MKGKKTMKKTTSRDNFVAIKNFVTENGGDEAWVTFLDEQVAKLDKRNEKAKAKRAEKAEEPDELLDAIAAVLTTEPKTIDEILAEVEFEDATKNKVSSRINKIPGVVKTEIKVEVDGKKLRRAAYAIA